MSKAQIQRAVLRLPAEDRLEIAHSIYESLGPQPLSERQQEVLRQRAAEADAHPERFSSWAEAQDRIRQKLAASSKGA